MVRETWLSIARYDSREWRLVLSIRGVRYVCEGMSPFMLKNFQRVLKRNQSHALKYLEKLGRKPKREEVSKHGK